MFGMIVDTIKQKKVIILLMPKIILIGHKLTDGIIHIYLIKDVGKPENRLPSRSKNVGQGDRNVLELTSEPLYKGTLKDWIFHLNYKENYKVQGTIHVKYDELKTISQIY